MSATDEICYWIICFVPQGKEIPRLFGFAEFISSLALMVIVFTLTDARYRFRIAVAPTSLYRLTYGLIAFIGIATLITEVWIAEAWPVPRTYFSRAIWQATLGALFLCVFMTWAWYAFIRPPIFGKRNAARFATALYWLIVRGSDDELPAIADELGRSAHSLVEISPEVPEHNSNQPHPQSARDASSYAYEVLLLIANRKFCRHIATSAPETAIALFSEAAEQKKYRLPLGKFAVNISSEALTQKDSILYHEGDRFASDLLGAIRPFSRALYGNFELVEGLASFNQSPLDIDYRDQAKWDSTTWEKYCSVTLLVLKSYLDDSRQPHSYAIHRAFSDIQGALSGLHRATGAGDEFFHTDDYKRFKVVVEFAIEACNLISDCKQQPWLDALRLRADQYGRTIYDQIARLMFEVVFMASTVKSPVWTAWSVQHNDVWSSFMETSENSLAWKIVRFKLRRLIYNEVLRMPNYKGARIVGLCLNVMGLVDHKNTYGRSYRPLAIAVRTWAQKNYRELHQKYPPVAEAILVGSLRYDQKENRLAKTYLADFSGNEPEQYLALDGEASGQSTTVPRRSKAQGRNRTQR